ncbi:glycoside hydrolase family 68 protein [Sporolactobacillus pectinivorans]|uniref:glycoside hydrolase family 68 protein n=1 Tax=Sporolactobacillus pectinivorans TaxID=1591408 RepID=UPI000C2618FF|nr:glycoside hydrolase family 68 protein [Sporolactobacillus pectinivorans]
MMSNKLVKHATAIAITTALLLGGATQTFAKNSVTDNNDYGVSHITRYDMEKIPSQQNNAQFSIPKFDPSTIQNIPSAQGLDVWDSWPLQNADGTVANYQGYHLVFALAGDPNNSNDTHIYLFYQKVGDTSLGSWKNAGKVFTDGDKLVPGDQYLKYQTQEWSGSATLTDNGMVRLFYTDYSGATQDGGSGLGNQVLTTAQVDLSQPDANTLKVDGVEDHKSIFDGGDGSLYQNIQQFQDEGLWNSGDNHTLRDPHFIEDNGHKYLVFEANTGTSDGYQGDQSLNNKAYYGGSDTFFQNDRNNLLQSPKKQLASLANGALGIVELNDDYTVKKVLPPLITANTVTDEIERANVFKLKGKWYLFTDSRGSKMTISGIGDQDIYMLGYVSNSLTGPYKPLNGSGLVLHQNIDPNDTTWTYSHFAIPQTNSNNVVITSYMTNRGLYPDHHSTFAPSFLLNIHGPQTSVVPNSLLSQGQLTSNQ